MRCFKKLSGFIFIYFLLLILPIFAQNKKIIIESHQYTVDQKTKIITYQKPRVILEDGEVTCNQLIYDQKNKILNFNGDISYLTDKTIITAESAVVYSDSKKGFFNKANLFDYSSQTYINAQKIEKKAHDQYVIYNGDLTNCSPKKPGWKINTHRLEYNVNDLAYATNNLIFLHDLPIFYQPFLAFSTKKKRSSGLLPIIYEFNGGYEQPNEQNTQNLGHRFQIPIFFAFDQEHDLTLTFDVIEQRGLGLGAEYNYAFQPGMLGQLFVWHLKETNSDRDPLPTRYRFSYNHKQNIPFGSIFFSTLENSDTAVNREFFNSEIDSYEDYRRNNLSLVFGLKYGSLSIAAETREEFTSNLINDKSTNKKTYLNRLPDINLSQRFDKIWKTPLSITLKNRFTEFTRETGWSGERNILSLTAAFPTQLSFINIIPSYTKIIQSYNVDYHGDTEETKVLEEILAQDPNTFHWEILNKKIELNMEIFRLFKNQQEQATHKLVFIPRLIFEEIDDVDQRLGLNRTQTLADYAYTTSDYDVGTMFDQYDRRLSRKSLILRWDTSFYEKEYPSEKISKIFTLDIIQPFNLNRADTEEEQTQNFLGPSILEEYQETEAGEQRLPLRLKFAFTPHSNFTSKLFYRYDHQEKRIIETQINLKVTTSNQSKININYEKNLKTYYDLDGITLHPKTQRYTLSSFLKVNDQFDFLLSGMWDFTRKNLDSTEVQRLNRNLLLSEIKINFHQSCYSISVGYKDAVRIETNDVGVREEYMNKIIYISFSILGNEMGSDMTLD